MTYIFVPLTPSLVKEIRLLIYGLIEPQQLVLRYLRYLQLDVCSIDSKKDHILFLW